MTPTEYSLSHAQRKAVRLSAAATGTSIPIRIIPGIALAPQLLGERARYTTKTGLPIRHPNSYSRSGYSSMVYHPSTIHIDVGELWIDWIKTRKGQKK